MLDKLKMQTKYTSKICVCGFLYLSFIHWLICFPAQIIHISWNMLFFLLILVYALHIMYIFKNTNHCFLLNKNSIKHHVKQYWFLYTLTACFTIMAMASQFPYFELNYDDAYYLSSIVQEIGNIHIGNVNYFNGLETSLDIVRIMNTFALQYAFWAEFFQVEPVAFARVAAVIQNYMFIFGIYHVLFCELSKKEKGSQYYLIPFAAFLIPAGYLHANSIIAAYDDWQINTAIWYGSSIVRLGGLPLLIIFGKQVVEEVSVCRCISYLCLCIVLFSYSSIALPIILLMTLFLVLYFVWLQFMIIKESYAIKIMALIVLLLLYFALVIPYVIYQNVPGIREQMDIALGGYREYTNTYLVGSCIILYMLPCVFMIAIFIRNTLFKIYTGILFFLTLLFFSSAFDKFVVLICMNYNFVGLRITTSIQMFIFALCSYGCISFVKREKILAYISFIALISINSFNYFHLAEYRNLHTFESSGLSQYGFSFSRVLKNNHMQPEIFISIGHYFNQKDDKVKVLAPAFINYENAQMRFSDALVFSSKNISIFIKESETEKEINEFDALNHFLNGEAVDAYELLNKHQIEYIVTDNEEIIDLEYLNVVQKILLDQEKYLYILEIL